MISGKPFHLSKLEDVRKEGDRPNVIAAGKRNICTRY